MKTYKLWIEIEEYDDEMDEYRNLDVGMPFCLGKYPTKKQALAFAAGLELQHDPQPFTKEVA